MNITDFQIPFEAAIKKLGEEECDNNRLTIQRLAHCEYGNDLLVEETYWISSCSLEAIATNMETMAQKIWKYLNKSQGEKA